MIRPLVELSLYHELPLLNVWQRMHWRKRSAFTKKLAEEVFYRLPKVESTIERCLIVIERRGIGRYPDWDGLTASAKPLLDTLVTASKANPHGLNVIRDDSPACVGMLLVLPAKRIPGQDFSTWLGIYPDTDEAFDELTMMMRDHVYRTRG